jgi:hypothetical protein
MNRMHRLFFAALTATLGFTAIGCGAGGAMPASVKMPGPPADAPAGQYGAGQPGYPSNATAEAPLSPPPPPPPRSSEAAPSSQPSRGALDGDKSEAPRARKEVAPDPADRPGLGTEWGETRSSHITTVPFVRADDSNPISTAALFYNDEEGARAMSSTSGFRRTSSGSFTIAHGTVSVGLRDEGGQFLSGFVSGGRDFVVGESGHRYTIVLKNLTGQRFECVISVDGLDVLDGKAGSFKKRGYLLDPHGELEIDGFRQSLDAVAAFRFGSVRGSYANQKHGDTRNVGVIGVALFNERGTSATPWTQDEIDRRNNADPFPGRFATPPH